jgi:acetyltransferase-like isoleucine patch superfamily enzyme
MSAETRDTLAGDTNAGSRITGAVHGRREVPPDPRHEVELAESLRVSHGRDRLIDLYARFANGAGSFDAMMRRVIWRAIARRVGDALPVGSGVCFRELETVEIGSGVFIGPQSQIQGWYRGTCRIGNHVWIGPQSYFDARDLVLEDYVGWGPGAKVLGSEHTGVPLDVPIIQTDLRMKPVRICEWADIGTNAVILPGVTVGRGAIVGAGAVVTHDVPPMTVVAGVPARVLRSRGEDELRSSDGNASGDEQRGTGPWTR